MTGHPCEGMTPPQITAFELIATGIPAPPMAKKTLEALLKRGVIVASAPKVFQDGFGKYSIQQYAVPISIHTQWCDWCAAVGGDE